MSLKVIGTGMGRTGTHSLKIALEQLGFDKCYHMIELFQNPDGLKYFKDAEAGEKVNWDELFKGYLSAVDYPVARYYKQIVEYYPDAKIIHTTRDPESWFKSVTDTIFWATNPSIGRMLKMLVSLPFSAAARKRLPILKYNGLMLEREFGKDLKDKRKVIRLFNERNKEILEAIPKERLLVFQAKDGWKPLCEFLNVPVPDSPFPHSNTSEEFISRVTNISSNKDFVN